MKAELYHSKVIDDIFKKDPKAIDIPKFWAIVFKRILFQKMQKKHFGRCLECDARNLCGGNFRCRCSDEQKYVLRNRFLFLLYVKQKNKKSAEQHTK
jgi:hypothetical protein